MIKARGYFISQSVEVCRLNFGVREFSILKVCFEKQKRMSIKFSDRI